MTDVQPNTVTQDSTSQDPTGPQDSTRPGAPTRRAVLVGAGALGATGLVAACGTEADTPAAPRPAGSANGPLDSGPASGITLASVTDIPAGGGIITDNYVITQPSEGTFKAFSKVCTHKGCDVSEIKDGGIVCTCHNSIFSIEDGSVKSGLAKAPLKATKVVAEGDNVVTA